MDLTLSWFTRRIQPPKYNKRLICEYTGVDDLLRATKDNLPTDSLNKRIKTLVKITRGQEVPEMYKDIFTDNKCPSVHVRTLAVLTSHFCIVLTFPCFLLQLNTLAKENLRTMIRVPTSAEWAEEDPEDDDEEEEQAL
jgi:hypothetical protein